MKLLLTFILLVASFIFAMAQQDPLYSQYINNPLVINPAYGGFTKNLNASVSYRQQWTGFEGSPKTMNANGHISLLNNKMGAGLMIVSDLVGSTTVNEIYGTYSNRIALNNTSTLSFGLQAGTTNHKFNNSTVRVYDPGDPLYQGSTNETTAQFGAGVILNSDKYFIGVSVPRMLAPSFSNGITETSLYNQHFYAVRVIPVFYFRTHKVKAFCFGEGRARSTSIN